MVLLLLFGENVQYEKVAQRSQDQFRNVSRSEIRPLKGLKTRKTSQKPTSSSFNRKPTRLLPLSRDGLSNDTSLDPVRAPEAEPIAGRKDRRTDVDFYIYRYRYIYI